MIKKERNNIDYHAAFAPIYWGIRKACIEKGIDHIPIACKQSSVSYVHSEEDNDRILQVTREVFDSL